MDAVYVVSEHRKRKEIHAGHAPVSPACSLKICDTDFILTSLSQGLDKETEGQKGNLPQVQ